MSKTTSEIMLIAEKDIDKWNKLLWYSQDDIEKLKKDIKEALEPRNKNYVNIQNKIIDSVFDKFVTGDLNIELFLENIAQEKKDKKTLEKLKEVK